MPTVIAGRVRLAAKEKELIELYAGQEINPGTIQEFNAWIDEAIEPHPSDTPEDRLMKAVISDLRIDELATCNLDKVWKTQQSNLGEVLQLSRRYEKSS